MPEQLTLEQLSTFSQSLQGKSRTVEIGQKGRAGRSFHPLGVHLFRMESPKKASLANFTARMLILHSVLRVGYLRKISGTLFSVVLFISDEGNSVNFGFVSAVAVAHPGKVIHRVAEDVALVVVTAPLVLEVVEGAWRPVAVVAGTQA